MLKKVNLFNQFEHLENFLSILWFNDLIITSLLAGLLINKVFKNNWLYVVSIIHLAFVYFFFINLVSKNFPFNNLFNVFLNSVYLLIKNS